MVSWLLNMTVDSDYSRMNPDDHLRQIADRLGLIDRGIAMMTTINVTAATNACCEAAPQWLRRWESADRCGPPTGTANQR